MSILIKNGRIVTATDDYTGDVFIDGEKITTIGTALEINADRVIDAKGQVRPARRHRCPHAHGHAVRRHHLSRRLRVGHHRRRVRRHTTIVDFAIQYKGQTLHHAWETWMKKAEGKAAIDYGFHMIITDLSDQVETEMDARW